MQRFLTLHALNTAKSSDPAAYGRARRRAKKHIELMASLYVEQCDAGRYFLHEHPRWATSWQLRRMVQLMASVELAHGDQCQYGSVIRR